MLDVNIPVAPVITPDGATMAPAAVTSTITLVSNLRLLIALCCGTFVMALLFIVPPRSFRRWRGSCTLASPSLDRS